MRQEEDGKKRGRRESNIGKGGRDRRKKKLKKSKGGEEKILRIGKQTCRGDHERIMRTS